MSQARANGIFIEYESFGRDSDPVLLLVSGWSVQMLSWDEALCRRLAGLGLRVIRFDNRDCGLSTHFDGVEYDLSAAAAAQLRGAALPVPPYLLSDMADDAIGLLDALGISQAHIAGALHKPLDRVAKMLGDLDRTKPVVVHCKGGYRSAIACSLIQRAGFENVTNLIGGLDAWQATGLAVNS